MFTGSKRQKKEYVILVPHPVSPVLVTYPVTQAVVPSSPARPSGNMMMTLMRPMANVPQPALTCGSPAYVCSGPCISKQIGGTPAVQAEMPWNAQIYSSSRHICSGSLVDNRFVLTSASCVDP